MRLVDLHVPTSRQSLELNPDFQSQATTQAKRTAASDLCHCATGAGASTLQASSFIEYHCLTRAHHCNIATRTCCVHALSLTI